jgi:hypothetical protein
MGWIFPLEFANVVGYLTTQGRSRPPRLTKWELDSFFGSIQVSTRLISSDPEWIETVKRVARESQQDVYKISDTGQAVSDEIVEDLLKPLRPLVGGYELFGLAVGSYHDDNKLKAFVEHAAYSSKRHAIFLSTDLGDTSSSLIVFDPFPGMSLIANQPENWPGILFWNRTARSAFAKLEDAYELYGRLRAVFENRNASK